MNRKISALGSATGTSLRIPVVSGGATEQTTPANLLVGLGIPQYVEATCRATATVADLPTNSNIFDIYVRALVGSSANAGGSNVEIGRANSEGYFASIVTSGLGTYRQDTDYPNSGFNSPGRLIKTSGAVVAAAPNASANASFVVGIGYFRV
jgi:hypothetical protein